MRTYCRWFIVDVLRKSIIVLSLLVGDDDHIFTFITLLCSMVLYIAFEPFPVRNIAVTSSSAMRATVLPS